MCVTAVTVFMAYRMWANTTQTLKFKIVELQEKAKALDEYKITQKQIRDILVNTPETISENRLIEMLSEIALESGVQIISLSPTTKRQDNFTRLTSIKITIASENYADIIRFMHKLENSAYSIRVKGWTGGPKMTTQGSRRFGWGGSGRRLNQENVKTGHVEATIEIETVDFKDV